MVGVGARGKGYKKLNEVRETIGNGNNSSGSFNCKGKDKWIIAGGEDRGKRGVFLRKEKLAVHFFGGDLARIKGYFEELG